MGQELWCDAEVKGIEKVGDDFLIEVIRNGKEHPIGIRIVGYHRDAFVTLVQSSVSKFRHEVFVYRVLN